MAACEGFDLSAVQRCPPDQNFQMELPLVYQYEKALLPPPSSPVPHLSDSKGHEKGREIDSKSWWQESPSAIVHCHIMETKSHVFIVIIAPQQ